MYRQNLSEKFKNEYPQIEVTVQRIADQRRIIERNKLLDSNTLARIRLEVQRQMNGHDPGENETQDRQVDQTATQNEIVGQTPETHHETGDEREESMVMQSNTMIQDQEISQVLRNEYERAKTEFAGMAPERRPRLPAMRTTTKLKRITRKLNTIIGREITPDANPTLYDVVEKVYCVAIAAIRSCGKDVRTEERAGGRKLPTRTEPWEQRIQGKINELGTDVNRLTQYQQGNRSRRLKAAVNKLRRKYVSHSKHEADNQNIDEVIDTVKQKLKVQADKLRGYKTSNERRKQNMVFYSAEKNFYNNMRGEKIEINELPKKDDIENYRSDL